MSLMMGAGHWKKRSAGEGHIKLYGLQQDKPRTGERGEEEQHAVNEML